jgi:hypothetical protein
MTSSELERIKYQLFAIYNNVRDSVASVFVNLFKIGLNNAAKNNKNNAIKGGKDLDSSYSAN